MRKRFRLPIFPGLSRGRISGKASASASCAMSAAPACWSYVLDASGTPAEDFRVVRGELKAFDPELPDRPSIVALNKMDLVAKDEVKAIVRKVRSRHASRGAADIGG